MRAWRVGEYGDYRKVLHLDEGAPRPTPGPEETLIEVLAAGVNFADILSIAGRYQVKASLPFTPGVEVVGGVIEPGAGSRLRIGQLVLATPASGGYAEYAAVTDGASYPVPDGVDPLHAAVMLVTYQTSHVALFQRGRLTAGERLLVHGGAGGAGTSAIQLGKRAGAKVIATAGGAEKLAICVKCGADEVIDYRKEDFVERVREITKGRGVDVVYDPVGGDVFDGSTRCLAWEGRLLVVGFAGGRIPEIAANRILLKNISIIGVNWPDYRTRGQSVLEAAQADIWDGYRDGDLRPVVWKTLPFESVPDALAAIESRESYGKIAINVGSAG
ncbi:MAG: NADPH:quinone oxidoreductase family protein [Dehalococcoidia bacterium]